MELRFRQLMMLAVTQPVMFNTVAEDFNKLGGIKGFREAVLSPGCHHGSYQPEIPRSGRVPSETIYNRTGVKA